MRGCRVPVGGGPRNAILFTSKRSLTDPTPGAASDRLYQGECSLLSCDAKDTALPKKPHLWGEGVDETWLRLEQ